MNRFHVLLALTRAAHDEKIKLKTNHIHSEVAFSFGINNNVSFFLDIQINKSKLTTTKK